MNCEENVCYYLESINGKHIYTYLTFNNGLKSCCLERIYRYYESKPQPTGCYHTLSFEQRYYSYFWYDKFKPIAYNEEIILVSKNSLEQNFINEINNINPQWFFIFKNIDIDENITVFNTEEYNEIVKDDEKAVMFHCTKIYELKIEINQLNIEIKNYKKEIQYLKSINPKPPKYDYNTIKQKNKTLNSEFKRVAKLMKLT